LIRRGREALGISPEAAAARIRIKLSGRRWRQLEAGEESPGGTKATMSAGQLAHMASVVRLRPEHLESIGKTEAAAILRTIAEIDADLSAPATANDEDDVALAVLERIERDPRLQRRLRRILAAGSGHAEDSSGYGTSGTKGDSGRDVAG
jgi:hypothetical protein